MRNKLWDSFESLLAERILVDGLFVRKAVPEICRAFPEDPVGYLILALVSAANVFETGQLSTGIKDPARAHELYQAAAMVASDVAFFEVTGQSLPNCGHLMDHWTRSGERFFLLASTADGA